MTQTETKTRTITGIVDSVGRIKNTPKGEMRNVSIQEQHLDFPSKNDAVAGLADEIQKLEGQMVTVQLVVEKLKNNKEDDGKIGSYWWNITRIIKDGEQEEAPPAPDVETQGEDAEGQQLNAAPRKPVTDSGTFKGSSFPPVEGVVQGAMEKLAMDWFTASFTPAELRQVPHNIAIQTIRLMRDELFHDLKSLAIAPIHYCYEHEMSRARAKSGNWGHPLAGGKWCIERNEPAPIDPEVLDPDEPEPLNYRDSQLPISDEVDF